MPDGAFKKYGITFPVEPNDLEAHLAAYRFNPSEEEGGLGRAVHLTRAMQAMWSDKEFKWHSWAHDIVNDWCATDRYSLLGAGGTGKSTVMAAIIYADFLAAPHCTTTNLYSTTKDMLRYRIWREVVRLHLLYPAGFSYNKSYFRITFGDDDTINGIFGNGVLRDNGEVAVANLVGRHNLRNRCIVDEAQGCPWTVVRTTANQRLGGESFKLGVMGNPVGRDDTLGRMAEPEHGWDSVDTNTGTWRTKFGNGIGRHLDGEKSPRIVEVGGDKKYPFLIGADDIVSIKEDFGENSIDYWSQVRGFPRAEGAIDRCLDLATVEKFNMREPAEFMFSTQTYAGLDPSFSSGGDRCMLSFARVGRVASGLTVIDFSEGEIRIPMEVSKSELINYYIARKVAEHCNARGVPPERFGMDVTGAQSGLADIIETEWGRGIHRVNFAGSATDLPVSNRDPRPGNEAYKNRVTELWCNVTQFSMYGQIRGLGEDAVREFTSRLAYYKDTGKKYRQVEPKPLMRERTGYSPDDADSKCVILSLLRERRGVHPGGMGQARNRVRGVGQPPRPGTLAAAMHALSRETYGSE